MTSFTANLFMAGHGRNREREADLFASFYLNETDVGDRPLLNSFRKLKFARDAHDSFGEGGGVGRAYFSQPICGDDRSLCSPEPSPPVPRQRAQSANSLGKWHARQDSNLRPSA